MRYNLIDPVSDGESEDTGIKRLPQKSPIRQANRALFKLNNNCLLYHLRHNSRVNTLAVFADGYNTEPVAFVRT